MPETAPPHVCSLGRLLQVLLGEQGLAVALSCNLPASSVAQYVVVVAQLPASNTSASELLNVEREQSILDLQHCVDRSMCTWCRGVSITTSQCQSALARTAHLI